MAKRPILTDVGNVLTSASTINTNYDAIEAAFDNTLSRDGSSPNQMLSDIDLNSNDLLNVGSLNTTNLIVNGVALTSGTAALAPDAEDVVITDAGGLYTSTNVETALQEVATDVVANTVSIATNTADIATNTASISSFVSSGEWTPVLSAGGITNLTTQGTVSGDWHRVGDIVHFSFFVIGAQKGGAQSSAETMRISGMPFTMQGQFPAHAVKASNSLFPDGLLLSMDRTVSTNLPYASMSSIDGVDITLTSLTGSAFNLSGGGWYFAEAA